MHKALSLITSIPQTRNGSKRYTVPKLRLRSRRIRSPGSSFAGEGVLKKPKIQKILREGCKVEISM